MTSGDPRLGSMSPRSSTLRGVFALRAWRVGVYALPMHACYFSMAYLLLRTGAGPGLGPLLGLVVALWAYLSYGVLVNDFFDRDLDIAAGKLSAKRGHGLGRVTVAALLALLLAFSFTVVALLGGSEVFDLLWAVAFIVATAYSAPPLRLRARGFSGFVADSLIEKPLPVAIVFAFFGYYGSEAILFPVMAELLDSVFKHQVEDFGVDEGQHVTTFATAIGRTRSSSAVNRFLHPLNILAAAVLVAVPVVTLPGARLPVGAAALVTAAGFLVFVRLRSVGRVRVGFPFNDPPLVGYLNFALRTVVMGVLTVAAVWSHPGYLLFGALVVASILVYAREILPLFADFYRYVRGGAPLPRPA